LENRGIEIIIGECKLVLAFPFSICYTVLTFKETRYKTMKITKKMMNKEELEEARKQFDRKGYHITGEILCYDWRDEEKAAGCVYCEFVVFKGSWTRYDSVRDCGDHYIRAKYSSYERIDKETLDVTKDVEDI
jgi:hypothetical protein